VVDRVEHTSLTRFRVVFAIVAAIGLIADQVTKILVADRLHHDVNLVGSLLKLHLIRNPGAAFSTGESMTMVISLIAIVATVIVLWLGTRVADMIWAVALGLLLAGVVGNLLDRIFREPSPLKGHVVDFLELPHWPIFNLADVCINIAAALIIIQGLRGISIAGKRQTSTSDADS
jgi:signal peptidase II